MARNRFEDLQRSMEKARGRKAGVEADMARLGGRSRNDVVPDHQRGAASPLGGGSHSRAAAKKKRMEP